MTTRSVGVAAMLLATCMAALTGCSVPRAGNSAFSEVSGCAAVLPLARAAVHGRGGLVVIRALGRADLTAIYAELGASPPPPTSRALPPRETTPPSNPKTCVVVYQGNYSPGSVTGANPSSTGRYALIVARVRHPIIYRVLLVEQLPRSLPGT